MPRRKAGKRAAKLPRQVTQLQRAKLIDSRLLQNDKFVRLLARLTDAEVTALISAKRRLGYRGMLYGRGALRMGWIF